MFVFGSHADVASALHDHGVFVDARLITVDAYRLRGFRLLLDGGQVVVSQPCRYNSSQFVSCWHAHVFVALLNNKYIM